MSTHLFSTQPIAVPRVKTKFRDIHTKIPAPGTEKVLHDLDVYESRSMHGQLPLVWDRATGSAIYDIAGNQWIDFTSTIFVTNIGHVNQHLVARLKDVLDKQLLHSYAYPNQVRVEYLKKLIEFTDGDFTKAFLLSAGTEATEAGLKLMRMYAQKIKKSKPGVICLEGNWHGRTMGAQMMSGNLQQKEWVGYLDPNIHFINFPYPWRLKNKSGEQFLAEEIKKLQASGVDLANDICGFMLETFQGWGAVFYPVDFVQGIKKLCEKHNILLAFDEMQAGFGRTGKKFGYQHYGVKPDLICCGKGMSSGLPLSGVLGSKEIMDLPEVGNMSSTHSANPLSCAAGLATIEELGRGDLIAEASRKGNILHKRLGELKEKYSDRISYVLGKGLIAAVLFTAKNSTEPDAEFTSKIAERCMQKGLLVVHTGRESIKIGPPLTIDEEALLEGAAVFDEAVGEIIAEENK
jgi:4-aminobutyrate aminotransferase / (S)-3-amino-2-methylpropionate transaminase / 5-aminovalerate transaminase